MSEKPFISRPAFYFAVVILLLVAASIVIPTISDRGFGLSNVRVPEASNLSQIAKTYAVYTYLSIPPRKIQLPPGSTAHDAAFILAKYADLNDASLWFNQKDDALSGDILPKSVIQGNIDTATTLAPAFANAPLSVVIAANISTSAPPYTTPVAWTRGLQQNGAWPPDSPWQGKGGHIAFLDGHVAWYDRLDASDSNESLVVAPGWPDAGKPTANISEALPPGAVILPAEPRHHANP